MAKIRVFVFLSTLVVVGLIGLFASFYARGYRLNFTTFKFEPNGILVIKSEPDGASVFINGELKTATNATISLSPGTYDVEVRKDSFQTWYKRLDIQKEVVTSVAVSLFRNVPSLTPITTSGAQNPIVSPSGTKIVYSDHEGLWVMDTFSLPLGFSNDPKRITDGDMTEAKYQFSPDERQILLTTSKGIFLIDVGSFTPQGQRVNVASKLTTILNDWKKEKQTRDLDLIKNLPPGLSDIFTRKVSSFILSPDNNSILYIASSSATIPDNLIRPLPGSSTQNQERNLEQGRTYVYDIKEDRNFLITDTNAVLNSQEISDNSQGIPVVRWMPSSKNILLADGDKIVIMDYDGTNRQVVYSGSYVAPLAFPFRNTTKLLILTNLGAVTPTTNLYTLTVK